MPPELKRRPKYLHKLLKISSMKNMMGMSDYPHLFTWQQMRWLWTDDKYYHAFLLTNGPSSWTNVMVRYFRLGQTKCAPLNWASQFSMISGFRFLNLNGLLVVVQKSFNLVQFRCRIWLDGHSPNQNSCCCPHLSSMLCISYWRYNV